MWDNTEYLTVILLSISLEVDINNFNRVMYNYPIEVIRPIIDLIFDDKIGEAKIEFRKLLNNLVDYGKN